MLIARITGGIGNQLFQYAFVRSLSIKLNQKFKLDLSWYHDYHKFEKSNDPKAATKRDFLLNYFNIKSPVTNKVYLNLIKRLEIRSKNSIFFKFLLDGPLNNFSFEKIDHNNFSLEVIKESPRVYLTGYWQNNDIIEEYKKRISNDLILKHPLSANNKSYLKSINSISSVAIHFRRGDFISKPKPRELHAPCSSNYYQNGIKQIQKIINNAHFFIFSDDIKWIKNNYNFSTNTTFIDNAGPDYEHLFLMSQCKHQITANSTFSWWAAWLNPNSGKIIITPKYWYNDQYLNNTLTRIPKEWIKLNNMT